MNTTNTPYEEIESAQPEWRDPFPEPQTIPSGWDISEVLAPSMPAAINEMDLKVERRPQY